MNGDVSPGLRLRLDQLTSVAVWLLDQQRERLEEQTEQAVARGDLRRQAALHQQRASVAKMRASLVSGDVDDREVLARAMGLVPADFGYRSHGGH